MTDVSTPPPPPDGRRSREAQRTFVAAIRLEPTTLVSRTPRETFAGTTMQSRLFNELRAADLFGAWLKTTPEFEVKAALAESAHEEMEHAELLAKRIRDVGAEPFDYRALPAQVAMFNAIEGLPDTCQRVAGFSLAGEAVATYLTQKCLQAPGVPEDGPDHVAQRMNY